MPWALCLGDIDSNLICLEALEGEISNLVARKIRRLLQVGFNKDKIKRGLMLMREIPWSTLPVEQARGSTASTHKLHPMMDSEMTAQRAMLHMSRALFFPDAEDRCVLNLEKVIERLRRKQPRKMSGRQPYVRELMLEVKAVSRGASHSSQALKEKIMAQHVKMFNALSPPDKHVWHTIATDFSCKHARNIEQVVQHIVETINLVMSRARTERAESGLMQRVSMFRVELNDWAEL